MAEDFKRLLKAEFAPYRILSEAQLDTLKAHYDLLCRWNKKLNLCRIHSLREAIELHYCESLYLGLCLPSGPLRVADVGSGAGFPGFPVAVLRPECQVDLLESNQRKAAFLREACGDVANLSVLAMRAEDCPKRYDWVISRAVRADAIRRLLLGSNYALLTSESVGHKCPWGSGRYIRMFHVEH